MSTAVVTRICHSTAQDVFVRGRSLTRELIGQLSFTQMMFLQILGRPPTAAQTVMLDACLVTIMEHGLTPTTIAARMTYTCAPESLQGAVAVGLVSVGSLMVGTMEGCARLLGRVVDADASGAGEAARTEATAIVREHQRLGTRLPGFGHPLHRPDDPRTPRLLAIADEQGIAGPHVAALAVLSQVVDRERGRHLTVNATGAIAATLADCGVPAEIMRGFALISRCAGLVGHIHEEQQQPAMTALWQAAEAAVDYEPEPHDPQDQDP